MKRGGAGRGGRGFVCAHVHVFVQRSCILPPLRCKRMGVRLTLSAACLVQPASTHRPRTIKTAHSVRSLTATSYGGGDDIRSVRKRLMSKGMDTGLVSTTGPEPPPQELSLLPSSPRVIPALVTVLLLWKLLTLLLFHHCSRGERPGVASRYGARAASRALHEHDGPAKKLTRFEYRLFCRQSESDQFLS